MIRVSFIALPVVLSGCGSDRLPDDWTAAADVRGHRAIGIAETVLRTPFPADGSWWFSEETLVLSENDGFLELRFDAPVTIETIVLQADGDDRYVIEGRLAGASWEEIWRFKSIQTDPGLRTRGLTLPEPVRVSSIRVRAEAGDGVYVIGALRLPVNPPPGPARLVLGSEPLPDGFPWLSRHGVYDVKLLIAALATAALAWGALRRRRDGAPHNPRLERVVLVGLGLAAAVCWWNLLQYSSRTYDQTYQNYWDVYHYYIGSKYFPEMGYTHLYQCTVVADQEDGFRRLDRGRRVRNLETNLEEEPKYDVDECRRRFGDERWEVFKQDLVWFRSKVPPKIWAIMLMDYGYNPTPVWGILGRALASTGGASDAQISVLMAIDPILLVVMWIIVWRTFGWKAASIALIFWGTSFPVRSWWTAGAFLRQDWLFASVVGVCLLRRQKHFAGGMALASAALLRVFPVFLIVGVAVRVLWEMTRTGQFVPSPSHRRFALGVVTAVVVLFPLSLVTTGHGNAWGEFAKNSRRHLETPVSNFMGVHTIVRPLLPSDEALARLPSRKAEWQRERISGRARAVVGVALVVAFAVLVMGVRHEDDWVAAILGTALIPFAVELTGYYYALFLVFAFLTLRRKWIGVALCALPVVFDAFRRMFSVPVDMPATYFWSSIAVVVFAAWVLALFGRSPSPDDRASPRV